MAGNTQTVRDIYAAFAEGRIADILATLGDDVTFIQPGGADIPWSGTWKGPAGVGDFFARLAAVADTRRFEPEQYLESGETVVALGQWAAIARATGKPFASSWAMTWKFKDGKVDFYEALEDTSVIAKAFR